MGTNEESLCSWAELYVLEGLDDAERIRFEEHLASCSQCRAHVLELRQTADFLLYDIPEKGEPRPELKARVMDHVFRNGSDAKTAEPPASPRVPSPAEPTPLFHKRKRRLWQLVGAMAAVLLIGFSVQTQWENTKLKEQLSAFEQRGVPLGQIEEQATMEETGDVPLDGQVYILSDGGERKLLFVSDDLPTLSETEYYQVWFMREDGVESAGVFAPGSDGRSLFAASMPDDGKITGVAVSQEPDAYGDQPRGEILLTAVWNDPIND